MSNFSAHHTNHFRICLSGQDKICSYLIVFNSASDGLIFKKSLKFCLGGHGSCSRTVMVSSWSVRKSCTKHELFSLIGVLHHVCKVMVPGRTFLRHIINLSKSVTSLSRPVRLNMGFRQDLCWWSLFFTSWNGRSFFLWPKWSPPSDFQHPQTLLAPLVTVPSSTAAGSIGLGLLFGFRVILFTKSCT